MIGTIGVDLQRFRSSVALMEWTAGVPRYGSVGDGRRMLVPLAATEMLWGSAAAEATLADLPPTAGSLYAWRQDPWRPEFLGGLRNRLAAYLGQAPLAPARTHQLSACVDPAEQPAEAAELLDAAGLPAAELVSPADALVCRWLSGGPDLSRARTVLAVACGETTTDLGLYAVEGAQDAVSRVDWRRVETGASGWLADLAAEALGLCRPDTPARALLSLLDGADELAAALRSASGSPGGVVRAAVPAHVRPSRQPVGTGPPSGGVRLDSARRRAPPAGARRGGTGNRPGWRAGCHLAVRCRRRWPAARDGAVWGSGDPALDLAFGACWWPLQAFLRARPRRWPRRRCPPGETAVGRGGQVAQVRAPPAPRVTRPRRNGPARTEDDREPATGQPPWDRGGGEPRAGGGSPPWAAAGCPPLQGRRAARRRGRLRRRRRMTRT